MSILEYRLINLGTHGVFQILKQDENQRASEGNLHFDAADDCTVKSVQRPYIDVFKDSVGIHVRGTSRSADNCPVVFHFNKRPPEEVIAQIHRTLQEWANNNGFLGFPEKKFESNNGITTFVV